MPFTICSNWAPTSVNCCPARFVFVASSAARAKLAECVMPGNVVKVEQSPVTVIIGMDENFFEKIPFLFPQKPEAANMFKDPAVGRVHMMRNASLQAGYLLLAARALGLDCGPMSGFNHEKVDAAFFTGTAVKSNVLCGSRHREYGNAISEGNPRLPFEEACQIV